MSEWTEENIAALKELHAKGCTFSQIARDKRVGRRTRNACIGKALRLGLTQRGADFGRSTAAITARMKAPPKPKAALKAPEVKKPPNGVNAPNKAAIKPAAPESIRQSIPDQRAEDLLRTDLVQLLDLKAHHCRWPIGNPGDDRFGFCGHAKQGERPYCSLHSAIAFQPTPVRNSTKELIRSVRRFA